ncbi:unnamed protein product [Effrenium voratum]|nr:unnamed protein product [Effrenium voratum]
MDALSSMDLFVAAVEKQRADGPREVPSPMALARQAEVRLSAAGAPVKAFWTPKQLEQLSQCLVHSLGKKRCGWTEIREQHYGLSYWPPAQSSDACAEACCRSGADCSLFQYRADEGCWLGRWEESQAVASDKVWQGAVKVW